MQLTATTKPFARQHLRHLVFAALGAVSLSFTTIQAQAQVPIVYYSFQQNTDNYDATNNQHQVNPLQTINTGANISSAGLTIGGTDGAAAALYSATATQTGAALEATGWTATGATSPGTAAPEYLSFTTSTSNLTDLTFQVDAKRGTDGPQQFGILIDNGSGLMSLSANHSLTTAWATYTIPMPTNNVENKSNITFYIYGYDVTGTGHKSMAIDNLQILTSRIQGGTNNLVNEGIVYEATTSATGRFDRNQLMVSGAQVSVGSPLNINTITVNSGRLNVYSNITTKSAASGLSVQSNGTIAFGPTVMVDGVGGFTLNNGATMHVASPDGISASGATGNVQVTGTRTYDANANYVYKSGGTAYTGDGLPILLTGDLTVDLATPVSQLNMTNAATTVSGDLILTNGKIKTAPGNALVLNNTTTVSGANANSFIDGPLTYQVAGATAHNLNFEIGSGANYRKLNLAVSHNDADPVTYIANQVESAAPGTTFATGGDELDKVSKVRYFTLDLNKTGSTVVSGTVTLSYGSDDGVTEASTLRVATQSGGNWTSVGGTGNSGTITSGNIAALGNSNTFTLGNAKNGANPLPVELVSFTATKKAADVVLKWATASEKNNKGFEVQAANNTIDFRTIGYVESQNSNATSVQQYNFTDNESNKQSTRYYRLKQLDFDGKVSYSAIRAVTFGKTKTEVALYPNPIEQELNLILNAKTYETATITLTDALGKVVYTQALNLAEGQNQATVQLPASVSNGLYNLAVQTSEGTTYQKVLKK